MKQNIFGTDGIRQKVGCSPLTHHEIIKLGIAIAHWAQKKYCKHPKILLGNDTRESCDIIKAALKTGLLLSPIAIYDAGIIPTPAIAAINHYFHSFDCAIIITASHNPFEYNGIKIIDATQGKIDHNDETYIQDYFFFPKKHKNAYRQLGRDYLLYDAQEKYKNIIIKHFVPNFLHGLKIVIDCAHGATSMIAPAIFEQLGAHITAIASNPNGRNINKNCGSQCTTFLQKTVLENNVDIGFAFDGDGDRISIITKHGHIKNGDDILALLTKHPLYQKQDTIVGTIISNYGLEKYLKAKNKTLIRTQVGDKCVLNALEKNNLLFGGEQSGHIIMKDHLKISDGIFAALRILETIQETRDWELQTFEKFPQIMINIPIKEKKALQSAPIAKIIHTYKQTLTIGNIIVRYSGTEDVLRVMVEAENMDLAQEACVQLSHDLKKELNP